MQTAARTLKLLIRLTGGTAMLLGLAFWAGYLRGWLPLHLVAGLGLVLSLWGVAILAWRSGTRPGMATFVVFWGVAILWLGVSQSRLLPGSWHWIIALTHLLAGGVGIAAGATLAMSVERRPVRVPSGPPVPSKS